MVRIAVVIPTLNEAGSIGKVLDEISETLKGEDFEVLVVDGHSEDGTADIARSKGVKVIYQKNRGYGDALKTGFLYARNKLNADVVVMMDADLTYDPKDIPNLIGPILRGQADMVVGNRFPGMQKGAMAPLNKIGNKVLSWIARRTLKINVHDTQCGIRAFKAELVDHMNLTCEGMPFATEMLIEAKFAYARILEVPVAYRPRVGSAKLNPIRDGLMILGTIIRLIRDTSPLLFFGTIGFVFMIVGVFFGVEITLEWVRTGTVGRIPTLLLAVLLIIGGIQFFAVGLLADMIKRFRRRPLG
jgi:dolichol-phosphate mannosyltransferase